MKDCISTKAILTLLRITERVVLRRSYARCCGNTELHHRTASSPYNDVDIPATTHVAAFCTCQYGNSVIKFNCIGTGRWKKIL
jgi:hypothetical protein